MNFRAAVPKDEIPLRMLWQEAFGDPQSFLDRFFAISERWSYVGELDGEIAAMAHVLPCRYRGQKIGYVYAVATKKAAQGKGLASGLLHYVKTSCQENGFGGLILVPAEPSLFGFYEKLGYVPCSPHRLLNGEAYGPAYPLRAVSPRRYAELRADFLREQGVLQEGEVLDFQAEMAHLYEGKNLLLCASVQEDGTLMAQELLCSDPQKVIPGILKKLKVQTGKFRVPAKSGGEFAQFLPLSHWKGEIPRYFGLALE